MARTTQERGDTIRSVVRDSVEEAERQIIAVSAMTLLDHAELMVEDAARLLGGWDKCPPDLLKAYLAVNTARKSLR